MGQFQKHFCHAQINMRANEFCDVTLASVDGQQFKAHKLILSASSLFFKKILLNNLNHHPLIFMGEKLLQNQVKPFVIFITGIEPFGLNERVIEEAR